jgi:hypothetical protein
MSTGELLTTKKQCIKMLTNIFYEIKFFKQLDYMKIRKHSLAKHLTSDAICSTNKKTAEYAVRFYRVVTKPHPLNMEKANSYRSKIISSLQKKIEYVKKKCEKCTINKTDEKTFSKKDKKDYTKKDNVDKKKPDVNAGKRKDRKEKKEKKVSFSMSGGYENKSGYL